MATNQYSTPPDSKTQPKNGLRARKDLYGRPKSAPCSAEWTFFPYMDMAIYETLSEKWEFSTTPRAPQSAKPQVINHRINPNNSPFKQVSKTYRLGDGITDESIAWVKAHADDYTAPPQRRKRTKGGAK